MIEIELPVEFQFVGPLEPFAKMLRRTEADFKAFVQSEADKRFALAEVVLRGLKASCWIIEKHNENGFDFGQNVCRLLASNATTGDHQKIVEDWPKAKIDFQICSKFHRGGNCDSAFALAIEFNKSIESVLFMSTIRAYKATKPPIGIEVDSLQAWHKEFWKLIKTTEIAYLEAWPKNEIPVWRDVLLRMIRDEAEQFSFETTITKPELKRILKGQVEGKTIDNWNIEDGFPDPIGAGKTKPYPRTKVIQFVIKKGYFFPGYSP